MRRINEQRWGRGRITVAQVVMVTALTAAAGIAFGPGAGAATNPQGPDVTTMGTQDELVRFVASYVTFS